jgi:hypothetical protein
MYVLAAKRRAIVLEACVRDQTGALKKKARRPVSVECELFRATERDSAESDLCAVWSGTLIFAQRFSALRSPF